MRWDIKDCLTNHTVSSWYLNSYTTQPQRKSPCNFTSLFAIATEYRIEYVGKLDEVLMIKVTLILFKKYSFFQLTVSPSSHSPYPIQLLFFDEESRSMPNIYRKRTHPPTKILATFASPAPPNWNQFTFTQINLQFWKQFPGKEKTL